MNIEYIKVSGLYKTNNSYMDIVSSIERKKSDSWCLTFPSNEKVYFDTEHLNKILQIAISNNFYEWIKEIYSINKPLFSLDFNFFKTFLVDNNLGMELVDSLMLITHRLLDSKCNIFSLNNGIIFFDEIKQKDKNKIIIPKKEIQNLILSNKCFFQKLKEIQWFFECKVILNNNEEYKFIYRPFNTIPLYCNYDEMNKEEKFIISQIREEYKRLIKDF